MKHPEGPPGDPSALLIDPSVVGQSHILVNTGVVRLALARYSRISVIAEVSHCEALKEYLGPEACERITFVPWHRRSDIRKTVRDFISGKKFDQILFTNMEYDMFVYMCLFHQGASRKPIRWVLHSHLVEAAATDRRVRIKNVIKWYFFFRAFRGARFIVLGDRIRANVEELIGPLFRRGHIGAVIHPVGVAPLPQRGAGSPLRSNRLPQVIFMAGWHALSPKNRALLDALEGIHQEDRRFEVEVVSNRIDGVNDNKAFSMEYTDRLNRIAAADFFLHLPSDPYRLQASGAVMDMLLTGTPMIGLRTDFGEELAGIIGPFGYFFDTRDELLRFLSSASPNPTEVESFRANLASGYDKIVARSQAQFDELLAS